MSYSTSTQCASWTFTAAGLAACRARQRAEPADGSRPRSFAPAYAAAAAPPAPVDEPPAASPLLSGAEEGQVLRFYEGKFYELVGRHGKGGGKLRRPSDRCASTACAFFKRFYLSNSVATFKPLAVMAAAIFLAGKTEDSHFGIECIEAATRVPRDEILAHERVLLVGLRFDLLVHHPHGALDALVERVAALRHPSSEGGGAAAVSSSMAGAKKAARARAKAEAALKQRLAEAGRDRLAHAFTTDGPLVCHPTHLALAALAGVPAGDALTAAERGAIAAQLGGGDALLAAVAAAERVLAEAVPVADLPPDELKAANKKLKASVWGLRAKGAKRKREEVATED